ncbi:hypothetical protein BH24ACT15_BH24ACT15_34940 [soil metagenome]
MTTTPAQAERIIGDRPQGRAIGNERWVTITEDDGELFVNAYTGWLNTDEVRLSGKTAVALADSIAHQMIADNA